MGASEQTEIPAVVETYVVPLVDSDGLADIATIGDKMYFNLYAYQLSAAGHPERVLVGRVAMTLEGVQEALPRVIAELARSAGRAVRRATINMIGRAGVLH